jgi:hypothetical protein
MQQMITSQMRRLRKGASVQSKTSELQVANEAFDSVFFRATHGTRHACSAIGQACWRCLTRLILPYNQYLPAAAIQSFANGLTASARATSDCKQ